MKKLVRFTLLLLLFPAGVSADGINALLLWKADNKCVSVLLDKQPTVKFTADEINITTLDGIISFPANEIRRFTYGYDPVAIENVKAAGGFEFSFKGNTLRISHLPGGSPVEVFDTEGKQTASARTDGSGNTAISFAAMPTGVYVVKTQSGNFKISKP